MADSTTVARVASKSSSSEVLGRDQRCNRPKSQALQRGEEEGQDHEAFENLRDPPSRSAGGWIIQQLLSTSKRKVKTTESPKASRICFFPPAAGGASWSDPFTWQETLGSKSSWSSSLAFACSLAG